MSEFLAQGILEVSGLTACVKYYCNIGLPDESFTTASHKSPVNQEVLAEIHAWVGESCTMKDIIVRLRGRTVPEGYSYNSWIPGSYVCIDNLTC